MDLVRAFEAPAFAAKYPDTPAVLATAYEIAEQLGYITPAEP